MTKYLLSFIAAITTVILVCALSVPLFAASNVISLSHQVYTEEASGEDTEDDTSGETLPDPVFMRFDGSLSAQLLANYKFTDHDGDTEGSYEYATVDGVSCLKLNYLPYGSFAAYRTMPAFKKANTVTAEHKYLRITYMTTDIFSSSISLLNNANGRSVTLVGDTRVSGGKFVRSNAVFIDENDFLTRYINGIHCTIQYNNATSTGVLYIKELAFFATEEQAYSYYEDEPSVADFSYRTMSFGNGGTGDIASGDTYGVNYVEDDILHINYAEKTNFGGMKYMAKLKFKSGAKMSSDYRYMRVLYAADNPEGVEGASMYLHNDRMPETVRLVENLADTNGDFVLSDTVYLGPDMIDRFAGSGYYGSFIHNSLVINAALPGGDYQIKALYFFNSKNAADSFTAYRSDVTLTIAGNDISKYRVVIPEDGPQKLAVAAEILVKYIESITSHRLDIVTDSEPASEYEIIIGLCGGRPASYERFDEAMASAYSYKSFWCDIKGNSMILSAILAPNAEVCVNSLLEGCLYKDFLSVPDTISISADFSLFSSSSKLTKITDFWDEPVNVSDPERFTDDFTSDMGFWTEESGAADWYYKKGTYNTDADGLSLTFIHVYETNAEFSLKMKYSEAEDDGDIGLMLRYNSPEAHITAGYDFDEGYWYIRCREGADFYPQTLATVEDTLEPGKWYTLKLRVDGSTATLFVDGEEILTTDEITHITPGRIAMYAKNASVTVDDADILLLSGQGTIIRDIVHTKLPYNSYLEGGSVVEMEDGSLKYHHHYGVTYDSFDNGVTWQEAERWTDTYGYINILRLNNGNLLKIATKSGYKISQTSSDDGVTWVDGGQICQTPFRGDTSIAASAGNMNDKITQSATTGRIFYSQNYETTTSSFEGRKVFCEFYYSDDNGKNWTKSETDSWEIEGNETQTHFGECKILECADGTLRMYNSWNRYGCIVYSDSTDNGVTWGPLQKMEDFVCSCSSMQFVRDRYADNATTYYMVWVNSKPESVTAGMSRAGLTLAKSTDGKNWTVLGDIWRWESGYRSGAFLNHVVDPFVQVTEDYVLCGSGFSEHLPLYTETGGASYHLGQRQHIYSIKKTSLETPPVRLGDADGDGKLSPIDTLYAARYIAGWPGYDSSNVNIAALDVNGDGTVNLTDAAQIARYIAGWTGYDVLPVNQ